MPSGGVEIQLVTSRYRNQDNLQPNEPLGSYSDFTLLPIQPLIKAGQGMGIHVTCT